MSPDTHTLNENTPAESPKTLGGKREGAGRAVGSVSINKKTLHASKAVVPALPETVEVPDHIKAMSPLDILIFAAHQFATVHNWAAAASCAEKAAKYVHTPIAAKATEASKDPKHMTDQQLLEAAQVVNLKKAA